MELNREQIKKELALFVDDNPVELHLHHKKTSKFLSFLKLVLAVITTDEQKIFELENRLKECENGYEGTLYLERCKLHDAEEKIKELTAENEKLDRLANLRQRDLDNSNDLLFKAEDKNEALKKQVERLTEENKGLRESYETVAKLWAKDRAAKNDTKG